MSSRKRAAKFESSDVMRFYFSKDRLVFRYSLNSYVIAQELNGKWRFFDASRQKVASLCNHSHQP
jgi:hypothetical protein